jgi:hypothetical protein
VSRSSREEWAKCEKVERAVAEEEVEECASIKDSK